MRSVLFSVCLFATFTACKKEIDTQNDPQRSSVSGDNGVAAGITTTEATYFDSVFTRYGNGWTGGDGAISYALPDGRVMWLWGDSFLDTVYQDRHRPVIGFIHNQLTTMNLQGGDFTTYYGGTEKNPLPFFQANGQRYYWPTFAFMNKDKTQVFVFLNKIKATGEGGAFGFKVVGNDIAILNYPQLTIQKIVPFSDAKTVNWSGDAWEDNDGYIYLYGLESTQYNKFIHVARASKTNPLNITYYNGSDWVSDATQSVRLQGGVSQGLSFFQYQGKYYLLSQGNLLSPDIYIWDAQSPVGPFTRKRLIYTTPLKVGDYDVWTYNAKAHLAFTTDNQLLVGYCTNAISNLGIFRNADTYRPYFIWASNWQ